MHRRNKPVIVLLALCLAGLLMLGIAAPALAAGDLNVAVIDVEGNNKIPTDTIMKVITHTQIGEAVDPAKIDADIQAVMGMGYFSLVDWRMERVIGGIKIVFKVVENPPLTAIEVKGLTKVNPDKLKDMWGLKPGDIINTVTLGKGIEKAVTYCSEQGGVLVKVANVRSTAEGVITIDFVELKLGAIKIKGNDKTKEEVIRREISAKVGEIFDIKQFREDLQNLYRMGFLDDIQVPDIAEGPNPGEITITVEVKERKSRLIGFNFGYSRDTSFTGGLEFSDSNVFGLAQSLKTSLSLQLKDGSSTFELAYNVPWLGPYHSSLGLEAYSRYDKDQTPTSLDWGQNGPLSVNRRTNGGTVSLGFPLISDIEGSFRLKVEQIHESTIGLDPPATVDYSNRSLTLQLVRNKLVFDTGTYVNGGNYSLFSVERAGGLLGGDTNFWKVRGETRQFLSLAPKHVVGVRLGGGLLEQAAGTQMSDYDLFNLGGAETLRGYDYRETGLTGDRYALLNAEYRYRFNQTFEGVLFLDAGDAWDPNSAGDPNNQSFKLNLGYGLGVRINVPILGQIRFDYGFRPGSSGRFYFSFGEMF